MGQPGSLVQYGILTEQSAWRLHVCFGERACYLFSTAEVRQVCLSGRYPPRYATQPGAEGAITGAGYAIPPQDIPGCKKFRIPAACGITCVRRDSPAVKGQKAEAVARWMLENGYLSLPMTVNRLDDRALQFSGRDLHVAASTTIEVKCDYDGGVDGTGNLFIQFAERHVSRK